MTGWTYKYATGIGVYRNSSWRSGFNEEPIQGSYDGVDSLQTGCMWFDLADIRSSLSDKIITGVSLACARTAAGQGSNTNLYVYGLLTAPGVTPSLGNLYGTFSLPYSGNRQHNALTNGILTDILNNSNLTGFAIYTSSYAYVNYTRLEGTNNPSQEPILYIYYRDAITIPTFEETDVVTVDVDNEIDKNGLIINDSVEDINLSFPEPFIELNTVDEYYIYEKINDGIYTLRDTVETNAAVIPNTYSEGDVVQYKVRANSAIGGDSNIDIYSVAHTINEVPVLQGTVTPTGIVVSTADEITIDWPVATHDGSFPTGTSEVSYILKGYKNARDSLVIDEVLTTNTYDFDSSSFVEGDSLIYDIYATDDWGNSETLTDEVQKNTLPVITEILPELPEGDDFILKQNLVDLSWTGSDNDSHEITYAIRYRISDADDAWVEGESVSLITGLSDIEYNHDITSVIAGKYIQYQIIPSDTLESGIAYYSTYFRKYEEVLAPTLLTWTIDEVLTGSPTYVETTVLLGWTNNTKPPGSVADMEFSVIQYALSEDNIEWGIWNNLNSVAYPTDEYSCTVADVTNFTRGKYIRFRVQHRDDIGSSSEWLTDANSVKYNFYPPDITNLSPDANDIYTPLSVTTPTISFSVIASADVDGHDLEWKLELGIGTNESDISWETILDFDDNVDDSDLNVDQTGIHVQSIDPDIPGDVVILPKLGFNVTYSYCMARASIHDSIGGTNPNYEYSEIFTIDCQEPPGDIASILTTDNLDATLNADDKQNAGETIKLKWTRPDVLYTDTLKYHIYKAISDIGGAYGSYIEIDSFTEDGEVTNQVYEYVLPTLTKNELMKFKIITEGLSGRTSNIDDSPVSVVIEECRLVLPNIQLETIGRDSAGTTIETEIISNDTGGSRLIVDTNITDSGEWIDHANFYSMSYGIEYSLTSDFAVKTSITHYNYPTNPTPLPPATIPTASVDSGIVDVDLGYYVRAFLNINGEFIAYDTTYVPAAYGTMAFRKNQIGVNIAEPIDYTATVHFRGLEVDVLRLSTSHADDKAIISFGSDHTNPDTISGRFGLEQVSDPDIGTIFTFDRPIKTEESIYIDGVGKSLFINGDEVLTSVGSYLPLTGGTITSDLEVEGILTEGGYAVLTVNDTIDADTLETHAASYFATSKLTTKGDLYAYTTVEARLGVGSNDDVLVADSSEATGLKWFDISTLYYLKADIDAFTATLDSASWTGSAPYSQTVTVTGMLSTDQPIVDIVLTGTYGDDIVLVNEWAGVYRITTANDEITAYALVEPTEDLDIQLKVVR